MNKNTTARGFTLVELSIVLLILGVLAGSIITPLSQSVEHQKRVQSQDHLAQIKQAIIGFVVQHGYLPCPVSAVQASGHCAANAGGLPAAILGVHGAINSLGELLDVWGKPYRYHVSAAVDGWKSETDASSNWFTGLDRSASAIQQLQSNIQVCRKASSSGCSKKELVASQLVWLVLSESLVLNESTGAELENTDNDNIFVMQPYSKSQNFAFDDQMVWSSQSELVYWMLKANWF